jgi:hypothetical protein
MKRRFNLKIAASQCFKLNKQQSFAVQIALIRASLRENNKKLPHLWTGEGLKDKKHELLSTVFPLINKTTYAWQRTLLSKRHAMNTQNN